MKILTVLGARPQFIKAAAVSPVLRSKHAEVLVHTGQHHDADMSGRFFAELGLPTPDFNLGVAGGPHGAQTGAMLLALEPVVLDAAPDLVLVYGDTNSTLAGALVAAKLNIPIAHVEAGLRSFNRSMPEEINRVLTDHVSSHLFAPSAVAVANLKREGIEAGVALVGDVMVDCLQRFSSQAQASGMLARLGLTPGNFYLSTIHRPANTDDANALAAILAALGKLDRPVVLPLHPRTARRMKEWDLQFGPNIRPVPPAGYVDMLALELGAQAIITDSGGVQKEAYCLGTPCITLRNETEWPETIQAGWNVLARADLRSIEAALLAVNRARPRPPLYGDGNSAARILAVLSEG